MTVCVTTRGTRIWCDESTFRKSFVSFVLVRVDLWIGFFRRRGTIPEIITIV